MTFIPCVVIGSGKIDERKKINKRDKVCVVIYFLNCESKPLMSCYYNKDWIWTENTFLSQDQTIIRGVSEIPVASIGCWAAKFSIPWILCNDITSYTKRGIIIHLKYLLFYFFVQYYNVRILKIHLQNTFKSIYMWIDVFLFYFIYIWRIPSWHTYTIAFPAKKNMAYIYFTIKTFL